MSFDSNSPRIPKRRLECDVHSLPLSPEEAFLLSRIDDQINESELALLTGLDVTLVQPALQRLVELGAIRLEAVTRRPPAGEISAVVAEAFAGLKQAPFEVTELEAVREFTSGPHALSELEELCDLQMEEKRQILDLYNRLDDLDHYALLRVPRNADKRSIKRAYYELAPNFHPDRYFRKDLGSFKHKMEAVFGRLTLAHDTLTRNEERAAYDAQLAGSSQPIRPVENAPAAPSRSGTWTAARSSSSSHSMAAIRHTSAPPPSTDEERLRRAALARKLLGRGPASQPPSAPPPSGEAGISSAEAALETLRQRRRSIQDGTNRTLVRRYIESAEAAQARGDLAAATNFYRLARDIAPDDVEVATAHEQTAKAAAAALAQGYLEQGNGEAAHERWQDAAQSYSKAANGLPKLMEAQLKAARALLKSQGDVRKAVDYARRAVALEPKRFEARHILAEAYLAAGLKTAAKKELDAMREIAPKDARLAALAKRIK